MSARVQVQRCGDPVSGTALLDALRLSVFRVSLPLHEITAALVAVTFFVARADSLFVQARSTGYVGESCALSAQRGTGFLPFLLPREQNPFQQIDQHRPAALRRLRSNG